MARRFAIHPPYLVDQVRIQPDGDEILKKSLDQVFSELHRWIRYQRDGADGDQVTITKIETVIATLQPSVTSLVAAASPYAVKDTDRILLVDATDGAFTVLLPTASLNKSRQLSVKKVDSSANYVTLDGSASGALIDGDPDMDLIAQHESVTVVCDGTDWWII